MSSIYRLFSFVMPILHSIMHYSSDYYIYIPNRNIIQRDEYYYTIKAITLGS